jgi:hypothetical protein
MPCGCSKRVPRPWAPRAASSAPSAAPEGASHRIISSAERQAERDAATRPPRASQPQA